MEVPMTVLTAVCLIFHPNTFNAYVINFMMLDEQFNKKKTVCAVKKTKDSTTP